MQSLNVSELPKRDTPQALARKYMLGDLEPAFYAKRPGGIYNLMRMADNQKSLVSAEKALKQLRELSGIDRDTVPTTGVSIKMIEIGVIDGKVVEMKQA